MLYQNELYIHIIILNSFIIPVCFFFNFHYVIGERCTGFKDKNMSLPAHACASAFASCLVTFKFSFNGIYTSEKLQILEVAFLS